MNEWISDYLKRVSKIEWMNCNLNVKSVHHYYDENELVNYLNNTELYYSQ